MCSLYSVDVFVLVENTYATTSERDERKVSSLFSRNPIRPIRQKRQKQYPSEICQGTRFGRTKIVRNDLLRPSLKLISRDVLRVASGRPTGCDQMCAGREQKEDDGDDADDEVFADVGRVAHALQVYDHMFIGC